MSDTGGKTDVRWSGEEWAALQRLAVASGLSPGRVVKRIVRAAVVLPSVGWGGAPVRDVGGAVSREDVLVRPARSAGSVGPEPPAGVAAPVDVPLPSAGAPEPAAPVALEVAVARRLQARFGARTGLVVVARREIRAGKVLVDGRVCVDPLELVDPSALSG